MSDAKDVSELEAALIDRAERLANEYLQRGEDGRAAIINEELERQRAREARIGDEAQADADRIYRRRVQAAQLKIQANLDRERWRLIQSVIDSLPEKLAAAADDRGYYAGLLQALVGRAAESIGEDELVASLNQRDLDLFGDQWPDIVNSAAPGKDIRLSPEPAKISGGARLTSKDDRIAVDASFEGRTERYEGELVQVIAERLFADA